MKRLSFTLAEIDLYKCKINRSVAENKFIMYISRNILVSGKNLPCGGKSS